MPSPVRPGPLGLDSNSLQIDYGTLMRVVTPVPSLLPEFAPQAAQAPPPVPATAGVTGYSADAAVKHIDANAHAESQGKCARYVREAIEKGGATIPLPRPTYAKDYGPVLSKLGFSRIPNAGYAPQRGDIVVIQPTKGRTEGHIQMFNGTIWVSDFRQKADIWPGPAYRKEQPEYEIFRP